MDRHETDTIRDPASPAHVALVARTLRGTFDFRGRSRRTELLVYWIAAAIAASLTGYVTDWLAFPANRLASLAVTLLLILPCFALFIRRLHDQERTGRWALLLPAFVALSIYQALEFALLTPPPELAHRLPAMPWWVDVIGLAIWAVVMLFTIAPGTDGANRYGPDPRSAPLG